MASPVGSAYVRILPSASDFTSTLRKEINGPVTAAGNTGGAAMGAAMLGKLKSIAGPAAIAAGALVIGKGFVSATMAANDLNESVNAVNVTYGQNAAGILALSQKSSQALGLNQTDFNALAVRFSSFSETIAGKGGSVVGTLDSLTGRAADFASVMNIDVADAAALFQSGLAGETEPLRQYGIDLSAAKVQSYAYANGIAEVGAELTEQQKIQARYGTLMEQTGKTQGDFANTSGGLANTLRRLGAKWDDLKARIGAAFLPVVTAVVSFVETRVVPALASFADFIGDLFKGSDSAAAGGFFDALKNGMSVLAGFWTSTLQPALAQFVGLIQSNLHPAFEAIAEFVTTRVVPGFMSLVQVYRDTLAPALGTVAAAIGVVLGALYVVTSWLVGKLIPVVLNVAGPVFGLFIAAGKLTANAIALVVNVIKTVVEWLVRTGTAVGNFVGNAVGAFMRFRDGVGNAVGAVIGWFRDLPGKLIGAVSGLASRFYDVGRDLIRGMGNGVSSMLGWIKDKIRELASSAVNAVKSFFGINSPSRVFMDIGHNLGAGLAIGISDTRRVEDAALRLASSAVAPFNALDYAPAGRGGSKVFNVYAPLPEQIDALRRAERYDDILLGAL